LVFLRYAVIAFEEVCIASCEGVDVSPQQLGYCGNVHLQNFYGHPDPFELSLH